MSINQNDLARRVALAEGKKEATDIAQIKETLRIVLSLLAREHPADVLALLRRFECRSL